MREIFIIWAKFLQSSILLRKGLVVLGITFSLLQIGYILPKNLERNDLYRDVLAYYLVKERIEHRQPVYENMPQPGPHDRAYPFYLYPPVFASVISTLPPMSFVTFARFWTILLYVAFWVYAASLEKLARGRLTFFGTMVAGLLLFMFPGTHRALELGQVDPLLWAFFGLALAIPILRGFFTAAVALVKPWGTWPLLFSLREGWRVWVGGGLFLVSGVLIGSFVLGVSGFVVACRIWLTEILPSLAQGAWSPDNHSLSFAFLRAMRTLWGWDYSGGMLPVWARVWLLGAEVAAPITAGWILRKKAVNVQLAGIVCAAILASPICWTTYCPVLLTLVAALINEKGGLSKPVDGRYAGLN
jgi:hypothetical protein